MDSITMSKQEHLREVLTKYKPVSEAPSLKFFEEQCMEVLDHPDEQDHLNEDKLDSLLRQEARVRYKAFYGAEVFLMQNPCLMTQQCMRRATELVRMKPRLAGTFSQLPRTKVKKNDDWESTAPDRALDY